MTGKQPDWFLPDEEVGRFLLLVFGLPSAVIALAALFYAVFSFLLGGGQ